MLKIAVVDDDKKFTAIYKQIIANLFSEHHVKTGINDFFSGKEFIKSLSITKYDLVFMDIDMPEVSGIDIAAELRNNKQNLDIIFVSAHPHDFWNSYFKATEAEHAMCCAHILRELTGIFENHPEQKWAREMYYELL
ncbi:MAG: response regulator, partial [Ruminococcus sp.]|nr:response regulator [Ruminococcus sp.]